MEGTAPSVPSEKGPRRKRRSASLQPHSENVFWQPLCRAARHSTYRNRRRGKIFVNRGSPAEKPSSRRK